MHGRELVPKTITARRASQVVIVIVIIIILGALKKYVTNSVIIFGELALFLGNGGMYQKHRILLMKDKHEEKFLTLS